MKIRQLVFICWGIQALAACLPAHAQDRRAREAYEKGQVLLQQRDLPGAKAQFEKAVKHDRAYAEAYFRLGQIAELNRDAAQTQALFEKAVNLRPQAPELQGAYLWLAQAALQQGDYRRMETYLTPVLQQPAAGTAAAHRRAVRLLETARFGQRMQQQPASFEVQKLPERVNGFESQYFPVLTADRQTLLFTAIAYPNGNENLYMAQREGEGWSRPQPLPATINTDENEGTASLSADGRTLVFSVCQSRIRQGFGNCDLYISYRQGDYWSRPENLGAAVNSPAWESQPSLSADGRTLFFVSDRNGGIGKRDIYVSRLDSLNRWQPARNAGQALNTPDDELSPFLHANGHTLFFASNGHVGMGGHDLWMSTYDGQHFSMPENLGYSLNTHADQVALFITADGQQGFYAQEETDPAGRRHAFLWQMKVPESLRNRFRQAAVLKGHVLDAATGRPLRARLEILNLNTGQREALLSSDSLTGEYAAVLTAGGEYGLFLQKQGYFYQSQRFDFQENKADDAVLDLKLQPIRKEARAVLNNVFFDSGSWQLQQKSFPELQKLLLLLTQNPSLRLEIAGHTDDVGDERQNLELSAKRARAVVDFLVRAGIDTGRITARGYGETRPAVANDSEASRALNRRIELKIL